jgi:hypothetical protein
VYPGDDLALVPNPDGPARDAAGPHLRFAHKNGSPYE